jgi:RNA polymerase sigma factor (sigma-70 family)
MHGNDLRTSIIVAWSEQTSRAMSTQPAFADFVRRIRAGDTDAAAELVRRYEPAIRLEVRVRLRDPRLRRTFDSMDVCQSVMASFFLRAAAGQYDLDDPSQLIRLLVGIARNKVATRARRESAARRDSRRNQDLEGEMEPIAADPTPSQIAANRELLDLLRRRLSDEERKIGELRAQGSTWDQVAATLGGTAQGRRKQLERTLDRLSAELGLEDDRGR